MKLGVSVIICTYNGSSLLPETIRHLALQQVHPAINWEIIIVDNASTDNTTEVALNEWTKYNNKTPFRVLHQPLPGLTHARNLAIHHATYEFILFCDDDNWLNPFYIDEAYSIMENNPSIGVLGGHGELIFENPPPFWATKFSAFAHGQQAKTSGIVNHNAVYGAGSIIRCSAYKKLMNAGFKPILTDRLQSKLSTGGDYELCYAIALAGFVIWYDERLKFKHFMPQKRINWDYCLRFFREGAISFTTLIPYRIKVNSKSQNLRSFNKNFIKTYYFYCKQFIRLILQKRNLKDKPEQMLLNKLKIYSVRFKLATIIWYPEMKKNFFKILELESQLNK